MPAFHRVVRLLGRKKAPTIRPIRLDLAQASRLQETSGRFG